MTIDNWRMRVPKSHISARNGASSSSTSTVSALSVVDGPSTRRTRFRSPNNVRNEPAGARGEQGRRIKGSRGSFAGLPARRVGHDQIGERADLEPLRNRQCPGHDQVAGPGAEDRGTENAAVVASHDLDETRGVAL